MRLDYIDNINEYGDDVVRLFEFGRIQSLEFRQLIQDFLDSGEEQLDFAAIDFIEPRNCNLILRISEDNDGITTDDKINFFCDLTREGYKKMVSLLKPFCNRETTGYQYLYDVDSPTDFLFSPGGTW